MANMILQAIAEKIDLPEAAFSRDGFELHWFAPVKLELCSHATLA